MNAIILAIFGAFCLSFISALLIIKYATNTGKMLDKDAVKKPQKMHFGDIPRGGGVGIFAGFCVFVALFGAFGDLDAKYIYLLIPSCFIFFSGFWEDLNNSISPKMRLFLQSIGALCAILLFQNCVITDIGFALPYGFGAIFTLFCIVGVTNAINIIDGFNGLASGCAILMLASIAIVAYLVGNSDIFYIALIAIGAIVGFFVLNFPRGKIFLGDGGAYLLGFLLAFLLVVLTQDTLPQLSENSANRHFVSAYYGLCVMIYPVFEVLFSIYRRKRRKLRAMSADKLHLHTLIFKRGTQSSIKTSMLIWMINAPFIFTPIFFYDNTAILLVFIVVFVTIYIFLYMKIIRFKVNFLRQSRRI